MELGRHAWYLNASCPACGGGSCLLFVVCRRCDHLALECEEDGASAFPAPNDLSVVDSRDSFCPGCKRARYGDFDMATSDQIRAAGFDASEYLPG